MNTITRRSAIWASTASLSSRSLRHKYIAFIHAYLDAKMGREAAESLFWKLAGSAAEGWYTALSTT